MNLLVRLVFLSMIFMGMFITPTLAQKADTIAVNKNGGWKFTHRGAVLTPKNMLYMMQDNQEAYHEMGAAMGNRTLGMVLGGVGGFMTGWYLGGKLAGGNPEQFMLGGGLGLAALSIPFNFIYLKRAKNAVNIYNHNILKSNSLGADWRIGIMGNRAGVLVRF